MSNNKSKFNVKEAKALLIEEINTFEALLNNLNNEKNNKIQEIQSIEGKIQEISQAITVRKGIVYG